MPLRGSPQNEIRLLRRQLKFEREQYLKLSQANSEYRARATRAEQELADWKRRFDALLSKCEAVRP